MITDAAENITPNIEQSRAAIINPLKNPILTLAITANTIAQTPMISPAQPRAERTTERIASTSEIIGKGFHNFNY